MKDQIRMVILSDHKSQRDQISDFLRSRELLTVFSYPSEWNPVEIVRQTYPTHILISIPDEITSSLKIQIAKLAEKNNLQIMAIIGHQDPRELADLLLAGVNGFIPESDWQNQLLKSIDIVSKDGIALTPSLAKSVFDFLRNPIVSDKSKHLTTKEIQVLKEVRKGLSYKELANHFNIGECTVRTHCKRIYRKLGVRGRIEAINTVFLNPGLQISN